LASIKKEKYSGRSLFFALIGAAKTENKLVYTLQTSLTTNC